MAQGSPAVPMAVSQPGSRPPIRCSPRSLGLSSPCALCCPAAGLHSGLPRYSCLVKGWRLPAGRLGPPRTPQDWGRRDQRPHFIEGETELQAALGFGTVLRWSLLIRLGNAALRGTVCCERARLGGWERASTFQHPQSRAGRAAGRGSQTRATSPQRARTRLEHPGAGRAAMDVMPGRQQQRGTRPRPHGRAVAGLA